jgi:hypothetical protein
MRNLFRGFPGLVVRDAKSAARSVAFHKIYRTAQADARIKLGLGCRARRIAALPILESETELKVYRLPLIVIASRMLEPAAEVSSKIFDL